MITTAPIHTSQGQYYMAAIYSQASKEADAWTLKSIEVNVKYVEAIQQNGSGSETSLFTTIRYTVKTV